MDLSKLFLYIPGVLIFLVGSGQQRRKPGLFGGKGTVQASVIRCDHVVRKDRKDRSTFDYYSILAEYTDHATGKKVRRTVKSPTEYYPAQEILLWNTDQPGEIRIAGGEETLFPPIAQMIGGALLILLAYWQNQEEKEKAMVCLCIILVGAGILLIARYIALKKRNLRELDAEIVEVYSRQLSHDTKLLMSSKYTYYPVVRYQLDGKENLRRCNINSSGEKTFKVGEYMKLYYDEEKRTVTESHAVSGMLVSGIIILGTGIIAVAALFAALLQ